MQNIPKKLDNQNRRRILAGVAALGLTAPIMAKPASAQLPKNCIKNDQVTERAGYSVSLKSGSPDPEASLRIDVRPAKSKPGTLVFARTPKDDDLGLFISKTRLAEDQLVAWNLWALDLPLLKDAVTGSFAKQVYVTGKFGSKKAARRRINYVAQTISAGINIGDISESESAVFALAPAGVAKLSLAKWLSNGKTSGSLQYQISRTEGGKSELSLKFKKKDILAAIKHAEAAEAELRAMHKNDECELTSGCFLTTAACDTVGLADDCWELRTLRTFRDGWLSAQMDGLDDIERYYKLAPKIVQRVNQTPDAAKIWLGVYWRTIIPAALLVRFGFNRTARKIYTKMIGKMEQALV